MRKSRVRSRKAVSTALGAAFFIVIVILSLATMWTMSQYEASYAEVREQMVDWDTDRISEDLDIRNIDLTSSVPGYTFDLFIDNTGGVLVNTARIYVYDQTEDTNLYVYDRQDDDGIGFIKGTINVGEITHRLTVNGTSLDDTHKYRIILATDRGRQFSYNYPPTPEGGGEGGDLGAGWLMVFAARSNNFQYAYCGNPPPTGECTDTNFYSAYIKPVQGDPKGHTLYRILINNTTNKRIFFLKNSSMTQMYGAVGATTTRYIVSNQTTVADVNPRQFESHELEPYGATYLYFAAENYNHTEHEWVDDSTQKESYVVAFFLSFYFEFEEDTVRNISMPVIAQILTKK